MAAPALVRYPRADDWLNEWARLAPDLAARNQGYPSTTLEWRMMKGMGGSTGKPELTNPERLALEDQRTRYRVAFVDELVLAMPPPWRQVVKIYYVEGEHNFAAIGRRLGLDRQHAKARWDDLLEVAELAIEGFTLNRVVAA